MQQDEFEDWATKAWIPKVSCSRQGPIRKRVDLEVPGLHAVLIQGLQSEVTIRRDQAWTSDFQVDAAAVGLPREVVVILVFCFLCLSPSLSMLYRST